MNFKNLVFGIMLFILINNAFPALLSTLNVDVSEYYLPFQIFALAYLLLYIILPKNVSNPFQ